MTLVTKIGFPKRFDDEKRVKLVKENIKDFENVEFLVAFGSNKEYSDINIYVLKKGGAFGHIFDGNVDFNQLRTTDLAERLRETSDFFEAGVIREGRLIYGNKIDFEMLRKSILRVGSKAVDHNKCKSLELLGYAEQIYNSAIEHKDSSLLSVSLIDLAHAVSYNIAAERYNSGWSDVLTFKDLIKTERGKVIKEIREIAKNDPIESITKELIEKWKNILGGK